MVSYGGSGRAKPILITEDEDYFYSYTRSGVLESKIPKSDAQKHDDFLKTVEYKITKTRSGLIESKIRVTPLSPYEIFMTQKKRVIC